MDQGYLWCHPEALSIYLLYTLSSLLAACCIQLRFSSHEFHQLSFSFVVSSFNLLCLCCTCRCPSWCDRILMNEPGLRLVVEVRQIVDVVCHSLYFFFLFSLLPSLTSFLYPSLPFCVSESSWMHVQYDGKKLVCG